MNKCLNCGKDTKYPKFCSYNCRNEIAYEKRICLTCKKEFRCKKRLSKKYCNQKCMFDNQILKKVMFENRKKFYKDKYGVEYLFETELFKSKLKQKNLNQYGVEFYTQTDEMKNKSKKTNLEKYGVEYTLQSPEIRKRIDNTVNEKYGGPTLKSPVLKEKVKKTMIEKYGYITPLKNENIKKKQQQTNLEKYGCMFPSQNVEIKNRMKIAIKLSLEINDRNVLKRRSKTRREIFYDSLLNTNRLDGLCIPLFKKSEYMGNYDDENWYIRYPFKCIKCSTEFKDFLNNSHIPQCPKCFPRVNSKPQQEILDYIKSILSSTEEILNNNRSQIAPLELDIYIPSKKIAIEFNGLYWHNESSGKNKYYHIYKTLQCEKKGIHLIHIFEDEWAYKQDIVKNRLKHILGLNIENKIYARKCEIKEIGLDESNNFLEKYHFQGSDNTSNVRLGAFYKKELISIMTLHTQGNEYVIGRVCVKDSIIGVFGKLLNYFIKSYNPSKIVSYVDRRLFTGEIYKKFRFNLTERILPQCWYAIDNYRVNSFIFNRENDSLNNTPFSKIWDCGYLKYEWTKIS